MSGVQGIRMRTAAASVCGLLSAVGAQAANFEFSGVRGSFDSTVSVGTGIRAKSPACDLITRGATGAGAPAGCLAPTSSMGDQGNLNYAKGDAFTTYLKGSHELLLKMPDDFTFLGRVNWIRDFTATHTTGYLSPATPSYLTSGQAPDASSDLRFKARLLDLWVSKSFQLFGETARVRVGNQVISWGESLFLPGGINATNAIDVMRLSQPGTQLKEAVLPAPIASFATGLGHGLNLETYIQSNWNGNYLPPSGSYWSFANGMGRGHDAYGLIEVKPKNGGQWGTALRWQPAGTPVNLGFYVMSYNDKSPNFSTNAGGTGRSGWAYAEDRRLFGISANMPIGDWAIGTELSYRPRDAVALNPAVSGCSSNNGNCWANEKKFQWHLTGMLSLTPSNAHTILKLLGADTATLMAEAVVVSYPGLKQYYGKDPISAGAWGWGQEYDANGTPRPVGTKTSWGYNLDFSWVYDGKLIPGWQVIPEVYYFQAVSGRTPNAVGQFMEGAKSVNLVVTFIQNPANWQAAINYSAFFGGKSVFDQPYRDRNFVGLTLSRNF
ncbi:DUF1302 domain-containing protein [Paraburkholderia kururiensis]|uniref:DUF1302 domain-containing protein n=2 Tax=Paraburkholderia kururiensis TaxID=984307 RepID=A0ABZ0WUC8_9BURK|nr:DUF1302 domain-containing protein [Paraburkholderia kururiensis]WQD80838.1 DUF1302 domain-containing protein [Paraburkholderia kururiensis]